ncbi:ABC transporter permease subunit [Glaciimonas sp. Gout2]|uniref:ABC transporter permease subunit n=2 Tax=Glaciimonas TaxID=1229970 RepID=UPI002AB3B235|nr:MULTISPECIES: ABC transporter permease subunit [unclassified Glaciimonas]MDY7548589.1 ABC transporter permease subunit [Glaciimonas sp. CA11.2]MEB0013776.1 ABC transporter permease subunit [Glaciimonas sp. Cout2]MEB0084518.1 ABC transporter permease subunit [Glaciimonas sp. Gout2]
MFGFLLRRAGLVIPTFLGITLLVFLLIHMIPGNVVEAISGERGMDPVRYAQMMKEFGLDQPLYVQYFSYLGQVFHGNLGISVTTHESVLTEFLTLFPATLELSTCAMLLALVIGVPAGILAAVKRNTVLDYSVMGASLTGYSMPVFWWALLLILLFSVTLGWTPVSGRIDLLFDIPQVTGFMLIDSLLAGDPGAFKSAVSHLILPTIALGTIPLAVIARMTRSAMLEVLREDYVRTARAKGLSPWRVIGIHALRNALIPVVTVIGLQVGTLLAGAILTETIFSWPGIGKWLVGAIQRRDYPVVQGGILLSATIIIIVNLVVDLLYGVINPRIRHNS